jgi:hypothetical protein
MGGWIPVFHKKIQCNILLALFLIFFMILPVESAVPAAHDPVPPPDIPSTPLHTIGELSSDPAIPSVLTNRDVIKDHMGSDPSTVSGLSSQIITPVIPDQLSSGSHLSLSRGVINEGLLFLEIQSHHPYPNGYRMNYDIRMDPAVKQTRFHFNKLALNYGDSLVLKDAEGSVLIEYNGVDKHDYWTEWYVGDHFFIEVICDGQGTNYGFRIDQLDLRTSYVPKTTQIAESYHEYANNYHNTWPVRLSEDVKQARFHFSKIAMKADDLLVLKDANHVLKEYTDITLENEWTEFYSGNSFQLRVDTDRKSTDYGFCIDQLDLRSSEAPTTTYIAESFHPYANNYQYIWPIRLGSDTKQMRLHFSKIDMKTGDHLYLQDTHGNTLKEFSSSDLETFWTDKYAGNSFQLKMVTDNSITGYGFCVDQVDTYVTKTGFLSIDSIPPGAAIWLDGIDTGFVTPIFMTNITEGSHTILLKRSGYPEVSGTVTVVSGQTVTYLRQLSGQNPIIREVVPEAAKAEAQVGLVLSGSNFGNGVIVTLIGRDGDTYTSSVTSNTAGSIACTINLNAASPGDYDVQVTNPDGKSGRWPGKFLVLSPDTPVISDVTPESSQARNKVKLFLSGDNFKPRSVLYMIDPLGAVHNGQVLLNVENYLIGVFDLSEAPAGSYVVQVRNHNGKTASWSKKFEVRV